MLLRKKGKNATTFEGAQGKMDRTGGTIISTRNVGIMAINWKANEEFFAVQEKIACAKAEPLKTQREGRKGLDPGREWKDDSKNQIYWAARVGSSTQ